MRERNVSPPGNQPPPDVLEALSLAAACAKRGEFEGAIVHLKEVLGAIPDHEIANGMLAGIYAELKMPERATTHFERVLVANPRNVLARFQLGLLQLTGGRPQEALETLAPLELGKPGEARVLLQQAVQRMPADHPLYPQLQGLLERRGT